MVRKKLILADKDEMYLNNLANFFMEKSPQLDLITFSRQDRLEEYLGCGESADILAVDEAMAEAGIGADTAIAVKLVLSVSMTPIEGYENVKKYQKSENLLNEILMKYAEKTGTAEVIKGKSTTKIAAFYSPVGGSGKTTLALAMATGAARAGQRVFYLNLESVDSVADILAPTNGNMSDVLLALKTKGMRADIKLAASAAKEMNAGFYYVSGVESISEYEEIGGGEISSLLDTLRGLSEYDLLVLDLDSGFSEKTRDILECADIIFSPVISNAASVSKLKRMLRESELHNLYSNLFAKWNLVVNQVGITGIGVEIQKSGLLNELPCCAAVASSRIFMSWSELLRSGDLMLQVMEPLIQAVKSL